MLQRLYYLPVILAAIGLGWRGGLIASVLGGVVYSANTFLASPTAPYEVLDVALEVMMFCVVGVMTGLLADREAKRQSALEQTTRALGNVYRDLQENFEQMKRAERLSALGQLSAGLAHEIRNPLAAIEGSVDVLENETRSKERRHEFLGIIQKESRRLNRLVTNFLDFAKPRQPVWEMTEIVGIVDSVLGLAAHAVGRTPITFRKEMASFLPLVECDPEQLKQVLLNVTINAIHAMQPNGGEITIKAQARQQQVYIEIEDQGCGVLPEYLDKIFDPFFTTKDDGTGLGLSVAYQIVQQHGGMLTAERNAEQGMTFCVVLPVTRTSIL
jgi:signal transduction histidine kinase